MIFVSYSDRDREMVEPLVIDLGLLGHNVYFEEKSLGSSHDWDEIFTNIEQSDAFIYTITRNTQLSYSRLLEYEQALALGKPIIPIRMEDIDLWLLPPGIPAIIDYHSGNEAERAEFARVLNSLPPAPSEIPPISRPEVSFALSQLYQRINTPEKSPAEEAAILLNLQEFLERGETFAAAALMLDNFSHQLESVDPLAGEVARTRAKIQHSGVRKPIVSSGRALKGLFGLATAAALVWVVHLASMSKILGDPVAVTQNSDPPLAVTPTIFPTNTVADVSLQATGSPTETQPPALTPSVTGSPTSDYLSLVGATRPPATATLQPPSTTHPPVAAVYSLPTSTRQSSTSNQQPPTQSPPTQAAPTHAPPTPAPPITLPTLIPPIVPTVIPPIVNTILPPPNDPPPTPHPPHNDPPPTHAPHPTHVPPPTHAPHPTHISPPTHAPPPTKPPPLPSAPPIITTALPLLHNNLPPTHAPPGGNHGNGHGAASDPGSSNHGNGHGNGNGHGKGNS